MKFTKKYFKESYSVDEEPVEELFNPNGEFGGDTPNHPHTEIKTDTQKSFDDQSDFEPSIPQTSDDFASKTKNRSNWYGMTNQGQPYGSGVNHAVYTENESRERTRKLVRELLQNRDDDSGLVRDTSVPDINRNNIPDINEMENGVIISKAKEFTKSVMSNELTSDELGVVLNYVITMFNTKNLSTDYRNMLKNKI